MTPRTIVYGRPEEFRVQIVLKLVGPPAAWESVARLVVKKLSGKRLAGGYRIVDVYIDEPDDVEDA